MGETSEVITVDATVETVRYYHPSTGTASLALRRPDGQRLRAVATMTSPTTGESISLEGELSRHHPYAQVLIGRAISTRPPASADGRVHYLVEHAGLTRAQARAAEHAFGEEVLTVLAQRPARLATVEGIDERSAHAAARRYQALERGQHVATELQRQGLDPELLGRLGARGLVDEPNAAVQQSPYLLALHFPEASFDAVDALAARLEVAAPHERCSAALADTIRSISARGHTRLPLEWLRQGCAHRMGTRPSADQLSAAFDRVITERIALRHGDDLVLASAQEHTARLYQALARLQRSEPVFDIVAEQVLPPLSTPWHNGLVEALGHKTVAIDVMRADASALVEALGAAAAAVPLAVTTLALEAELRATVGARAQAGSVSHPAAFVGYDRVHAPRVSQADPKRVDLLVCLDCDRWDLALLAAVLDGVSHDTTVVLAGDAALPAPVGYAAGAPWRDLREQGLLASVSLGREPPHEPRPRLGDLASALAAGVSPALPRQANTASLKLFYREHYLAFTRELVSHILPRARASSRPTPVYALLPWSELTTLNEALQQSYNHHGAPVAGTPFRLGDPVYAAQPLADSHQPGRLALEAFEHAYIERVEPDSHALVLVCSDGRGEHIDPASAGELRLDYARRPGRPSGQQHRSAILVVPEARAHALNREALYQVATSARRELVIVANADTISAAAQRPAGPRYTLTGETGAPA